MVESEGLASCLHISAQSPKMKGLQSTYMVALFGSFRIKSLDSRQELGHDENGNPNSSSEAKLFFNKILKI